MDWIRRNWPDLLIGLALLAVIAGIITTLMSGGSFFPFGQSPSAPISSPSQPATSSPVTPVTPGQTEPTTQPLAPDPTPQDGVTPVTPGDPAPATTSPVPEGPIATTPLTAPDGVAPPATTTPAPPTATTDAPVADTPATTGIAALTSAYRILVGSFGVAENAERHAAAFQAQGYPALTAQQGTVTAVLVGPYATRAEAEAALANIRASGLEANPILFEPDAAATTTATATAATTTPATATPTATGTTTTGTTATGTTTTGTTEPAEPAGTPTAPPTATSGTYIQVGAYNSPELAQPQRDRLEQLGYSTTLRQTEGSTLLRLWVGPFESDRVAEAREQLSSLGIENFVPSQ